MVTSKELTDMRIQEAVQQALAVAVRELPIRQAFRDSSNPGESTLPGQYDPTTGAYQPYWLAGDIVDSAPN